MTCKDSKKVSSRSLIELNDRENEYHQGRNKLKAEKQKSRKAEKQKSRKAEKQKSRKV
ncbi:hypothetical protein ABL947_05560 [Escherichia albertii]|uniref:hypothetical protein n=1 Tax=Escherichia albertii TaxID=208962 RepID=UPI0032B75B19